MFDNIEIGEEFAKFLQQVEKKCISDKEWEFPYKIVQDPIWETSMPLLTMILQRGIRHDVPPVQVVRNAACPETPREAFDFKVRQKFILDKFPRALDNPVLGYYPPSGFVGWHTNYGAPGWIILFNWSETGDGYFRCWKDGQLRTLPDAPGWSARVGLFRPEQEHELWHCARTECRRFSFSYRFDNPLDWQEAVDCIVGV